MWPVDGRVKDTRDNIYQHLHFMLTVMNLKVSLKLKQKFF